jgi:hypothetical protein
MKNKKILIIGHARHGKDTVAEMINSYFGLTFKSSSLAAAEIFIYDKLKVKYNYDSFEECYEDRMNHRAEWHNLIKEYNKNDKAKLAKDILKINDIYVGMRSQLEIDECINQDLFDLVIGIFDPRKPFESKSSFDIDLFKSSDIILINNGDLMDLEDKVNLLNL